MNVTNSYVKESQSCLKLITIQNKHFANNVQKFYRSFSGMDSGSKELVNPASLPKGKNF